MSNDIQTLLNQRKQHWNRFHQLRATRPVDAEIERHAAIDVDRELVGLGFTVLT
ncbi:MAG: hypothetical protein AAGA75_13405 [Cyanobacteria bacterium P01_E01_bin.6]